MPDQRSVMKEFRALDQRRRAGQLTPDEEARHARLLELIGPEAGAGGLGGGFDVNAAAERLRESLLPAGLRNRPPPTPELAPEPEPEPLDLGPLDAALDAQFATPADPSTEVAADGAADSDAAQANAWFDPASLGDAGLGVEGYDPNAPAEAGWDPGQAEGAIDPAAYGEAAAAEGGAGAFAYDPAQPFDPASLVFDGEPAQAPYDPSGYVPTATVIDPNVDPATHDAADGGFDPVQGLDPASLPEGAAPAEGGEPGALDVFGLAGGTVIDPNVDPAQGYDPAALALDPLQAGWDAAGTDPGAPEATTAFALGGELAAADGSVPFDPGADPGAAELAGPFDPGAEPAAALDAPFDLGAEPSAGEAAPFDLGADPAAALDGGADPASAFALPSGDPAEALDATPEATSAFALPEDGGGADPAAWDPAFASAELDAQGATDPAAWVSGDAAADPGALTGLGAELDAAAGVLPEGEPEPADPSLEPTEMLALGARGAAADGALPPAGWDASPPEATPAADVARGEYDEDGRTAAFSLPGADADAAGLEGLLPFDPAAEAAISPGETPFGFETPGEYDDTAGFGAGAASPAEPGEGDAASGVGFQDGGAAAGGAGDVQADAALDQGFAQESAGSFGAGAAPGWATGAEPLPWDAPAADPVVPAQGAAAGEELDTIDGAEILEEIAIDDAAFAAPALDFDPPAPARGPLAPPAPAPAVVPAPAPARAAAAPVAAAKPAVAAPVVPAAPVGARPVVSAAVKPAAIPAPAPKPAAAPAPATARPAPAAAPPAAVVAAPPKPAPAAPAPSSAKPVAAAAPKASATRVAGSQRVVVHTVEGQVRRGVLEDADLAATALALAAQPGAAGEALPVEKVKAIFFMLAPGEPAPSPEGKRVRVTFKDGRQVAGFSPDYRDEGVGFFMIPADTRTNTGRIWVYRSAVKSVAVT